MVAVAAVAAAAVAAAAAVLTVVHPLTHLVPCRDDRVLARGVHKLPPPPALATARKVLKVLARERLVSTSFSITAPAPFPLLLDDGRQ